MQEAHTAIFNSAQDRGRSDRLSVVRGQPHTLRHFSAMHLLEADYNIRTIHELLELKDVSTTMICTHVLNKPGRGVRSPVDGR